MTDDDARPCEHQPATPLDPPCSLPARFAIGIDQGAMRYWCIDHIEDGMDYFGQLVQGIREALGEVRVITRVREADRG